MPVLSQATLDSLPETVARPAYDRSEVTEGLVHFGRTGFTPWWSSLPTADVSRG